MKNMIKKLVCALMVTAMLCAAFTGCGKTETVAVAPYVTITAEGYDTVGTATFTVDYVMLVRENFEALGFKAFDAEARGFVEDLEAALVGSLSKAENLSNGDVLTVNWESVAAVEALEEAYGVDLNLDGVQKKVEELTALTVVDLFSSASLDVSGDAPYGEASFWGDPSHYIGYTNYTLDKTQDLNNGDTVTVTATVDDLSGDELNAQIAAEGYKVEVFTKEFTVEGLDTIVTSIDEITQEMTDSMVTAFTEDRYDEYDSYDTSVVDSVKHLGYHLFTKPADYDSWYGDATNELYAVFEITATEETGGTFSYYSYMNVEDVTLYSEGGTSVDEDIYYDEPEGYYGFFSGVHGEAFEKFDLLYQGFETLDGVNTAITDKFDEDYTHTTNME